MQAPGFSEGWSASCPDPSVPLRGADSPLKEILTHAMHLGHNDAT